MLLAESVMPVKILWNYLALIWVSRTLTQHFFKGVTISIKMLRQSRNSQDKTARTELPVQENQDDTGTTGRPGLRLTEVAGVLMLSVCM